jgi:hypothetical protein
VLLLGQGTEALSFVATGMETGCCLLITGVLQSVACSAAAEASLHCCGTGTDLPTAVWVGLPVSACSSFQIDQCLRHEEMETGRAHTP